MPNSATQQWLDKAAEDEQVVSALRAARGPWSMAAFHLQQAAFHLQQAAEKYIKAALVEAGIAPPKSHDLPQLLGLYPNAAPPAAVEEGAAMMSAYAWLTRYPGAPPIDEHHVDSAQEDFAMIKAWALSVI